MADYYRDAIRYLKDNGYEFKRQGRGDMRFGGIPELARASPVDKKLRSKVTANEILKDAGLPKAF